MPNLDVGYARAIAVGRIKTPHLQAPTSYRTLMQIIFLVTTKRRRFSDGLVDHGLFKRA